MVITEALFVDNLENWVFQSNYGKLNGQYMKEIYH